MIAIWYNIIQLEHNLFFFYKTSYTEMKYQTGSTENNNNEEECKAFLHKTIDT